MKYHIIRGVGMVHYREGGVWHLTPLSTIFQFFRTPVRVYFNLENPVSEYLCKAEGVISQVLKTS
jgi:hypothetical protein